VINVVVADDQSVVRTGLRTMLEIEPDIAVVAEAADGSECVERVLECEPDVVLMDIRMPVMDGIRATSELVARGSESRVCVLTNYGLDEHLYDAFAAGASGFLLKTDSPQRIVAGVRAVAEGEFALGTDTTRDLMAGYLAAGRPSTPSVDPLAPLTEREREVFGLVARGLSNSEISGALYIGDGTTKTHVARILAKLNLRDRVQIAVFAHQFHLVKLGTTFENN
jgi:DNA-binding NarL/FixJ family response regulator